MAEEEKSQKVVETYKAVAAGLASVVAALFTSGLGVAGTLIGTALTAIVITVSSAVFKVQLMKATDSLSGLPSAVQGRLSTQQVRIPGKPNAEPNPEVGKKGKLSNFLSRLRALPAFFRELPSNQRRKTLLAGLLAGLLATVIGLSTVTGIELVGGKSLSCLVWSCADEADSESSNRSGLSIFGGYPVASSTSLDKGVNPSVDPSGKQPGLPGQDSPQGQPGAPGQQDNPQGTPQQPGETPGGADPSQTGTGEPGKAGPQPSEDPQRAR